MPFKSEEGGGGGGAQSSGGRSVPIGQTKNARLLFDPLSQLVSLDITTVDDDDAMDQRDSSNTPTLRWVGGNALLYTTTGGGSFERQMWSPTVRLGLGAKAICHARIMASDTVPLLYFGLFNSNASTAILSAITDGIYFKKAASGTTTTCEYEWNNNGVQSAASAWPLVTARFNSLTIEIIMDAVTAGAGRVCWRIDGETVLEAYYDASTAALTLPYDEPLFWTLASSGTGIVSLIAPRVAFIGQDRAVS